MLYVDKYYGENWSAREQTDELSVTSEDFNEKEIVIAILE